MYIIIQIIVIPFRDFYEKFTYKMFIYQKEDIKKKYSPFERCVFERKYTIFLLTQKSLECFCKYKKKYFYT